MFCWLVSKKEMKSGSKEWVTEIVWEREREGKIRERKTSELQKLLFKGHAWPVVFGLLVYLHIGFRERD